MELELKEKNRRLSLNKRRENKKCFKKAHIGYASPECVRNKLPTPYP